MLSGRKRLSRTFRQLHIQEVRATHPRAYARLWRYLVADQRALRCDVSGGIYVRLVEVARALALRRYAAPIDVVLEVTDEFCPWNTGRFRLRGGPENADCETTTAPADIAITARDLGAIYLGEVSLQALIGAGLAVELTAGSVQRATVGFGWPTAPSVPDDF